MESIMFLNIKNSIFFNVKLDDELKKDFLRLNLVIEEYNLETSTYTDFIDYLEFQEYKKLFIIVKKSDLRLKRFKDYIQKNCMTKVDIIIIDELESIKGESEEIFKKIKKNKEKIINNINSTKAVVLDGLNSLISGIYPDEYNNYIKHLFIADYSLLAKVNKSILDNMLINSCIIIKNNINNFDFSKSLPHIFINEDLFNDALIKSTSIDSLILNNNIKNFLKKGIINTMNCFNIIDYMSSLKKYYITRIFIYKNGIYLDFSKNIKLTSKLNSSYYELKLELSNKLSDCNCLSNDILKLFFVLNSISNNFDLKNMTVVTPYNKGIFEEQLNYTKPYSLIGISCNNKYLCYSITKNKFYETEKDFNLLLEAYYKNKFSSLTKEMKDKISEFEEIIKNV